MSEPANTSPKSEAPIQVRVSGDDADGRSFDEISTAFPTPKGIMLETIHQLREGTTLEITHLATHRTSVAQVKALGPKLGVSTLVSVEGTGIENLWIKDSPQNTTRRRHDGAETDPSSRSAMNNGTVVAMPERALMPVSKLRAPTIDRFMETLNELVESTLEANLRPAVEQLTSEIPEHIAKAQRSVFANVEEKIEAATSTFSSRLEDQAIEVAARNEKLLAQKAQGLIEQTELQVKTRQDQFSQNLERELLSARELLNNQAETAVSEVCNNLLDRMLEESDRFEKQFTEKCQALAEAKQNALSGRAREVQAALEESLSQKMDGMLDGFAAEMEKRLEQSFATRLAAIQSRLEETANALSERAQQIEKDLAERFHTEMQVRFEQDIAGYEARFREQLVMSANEFHQNFMGQIESELKQKQKKLDRQAQQLVKQVADQNQSRIARLLKELGRAMEKKADPEVANEVVNEVETEHVAG